MVSWSRALQKIGSFIVPVSGGSFLPIPGRSRRQGSRIWVLLLVFCSAGQVDAYLRGHVCVFGGGGSRGQDFCVFLFHKYFWLSACPRLPWNGLGQRCWYGVVRTALALCGRHLQLRTGGGAVESALRWGVGNDPRPLFGEARGSCPALPGLWLLLTAADFS